MIGLIARCWMAEGRSNPGYSVIPANLTWRCTVGVDSSQEVFLEPHGVEGGKDLHVVRERDVHVLAAVVVGATLTGARHLPG